MCGVWDDPSTEGSGLRPSRLPGDPNSYSPTQPPRGMYQIQQRGHTTQLFLVVLAVWRTSAGDAVGFDGGSGLLRVLLEVSFVSLTRGVERFALFGLLGREELGRCSRGHRTRESDRIVHITANKMTVSFPKGNGGEAELTIGTTKGLHQTGPSSYAGAPT